ncbi:MAG: hypothetical protein ACTSQ8_12695 [Candidatus Helarchaeota archaeon]
MNEKADIWIFYSQSDKKFGDMIAEKIITDIPDIMVKTSSDLGEPPPSTPNIDQSNIVLIVLHRSKACGWLVANIADAIISRTKNIMILLRGHVVELPKILSGCYRYDFTNDIEFYNTYKKLINTIKLLLKTKNDTDL